MNRCRLRPLRTEYRHRYDLSNALGWLPDHLPTGNSTFTGLAGLDLAHWQQIESSGRSDHFYVISTKA